MNQIGLTMRVEYFSDINEKRDCIDRRWYSFLNSCNIIPVLIGNSDHFLSEINLKKLSGFILTGGNSLSHLDGQAPERDILERQIINYATEKNLPLIGVCRGMQVIQNYYGVKLEKIPNHVKQRHNLIFNNQKINVNSYHNYGAKNTCDCLKILAQSEDGAIESIRHKTLPFLGIMWHPEREVSFSNFDIQLFKDHFQA